MKKTSATASLAAPSPAELATEGWIEQVDDGFIRHVGPFWERPIENGYEMAFLADERHRNRSGVVQGGMLATLADRTLGRAARRDEPTRRQATVQLELQYIDSGRIGEFIVGRGYLLRRTRTLVFLTGEIVAGDRLIAHISGIWKIRKQPGVPA